jgi:rifampicin phosphotransferase
MDYICFLDNISENSCAVTSVGRKAFNLARLVQAGYPVPPGFCLTAEAFHRFWQANHLAEIKEIQALNKGSENLKHEEIMLEYLDRAKFPGELSRAIHEAYQALTLDDPQIKVAVRSSGRMEDGAGASFAGQYDTYLNICGLEELAAGIKRVWASLLFRRAVNYTSQVNEDGQEESLPVLVQQMVHPEFSGAAFSLNPTTGLSEVVIEAVPGLGEALVSGDQTPERYLVDRETLKVSEFNPAEDGKTGISKETVRDITELVLKVEQFFGCPQDVEWAVVEGKLYLLQSRTITGLGSINRLVSNGQVDMEMLLRRTEETGSEIWTDDNVGEVFPEAVTPLTWSVLEPVGNQAFQKFLIRIGINIFPASGLVGRFYGRVYFNQSQFQRLMNRFYPSRLKRKERWSSSYIKAALALGKSALHTLIWLPILPIASRKAAARMASDIHSAPTQEINQPGSLIEEIESWSKKEAKLMEDHLSITIFASLLYALLEKIVPVWSSGRVDTASLTTGITGMKSAEMGEALAALAAAANGEPLFLACIEESPPESLQLCLEKLSPSGAFRQSFKAFLDNHGHASSQEFELAYPRWREDPLQVLARLKTHLHSRQSANNLSVQERQQLVRVQAEKEMGKVLGLSPKWVIFRILLKLVQTYSVERENLKYLFVQAHDRLRQLYLLLADKLVHSGQLLDPDDIFYLTHQEIISLQRADISPGEGSYRAAARRREYRQHVEIGEKAPRLVEQRRDGSLNPLDEADASVASMGGSIRILHGVAASAGRVTGKARVIKDPEEASSLQSGEILVARSTNPSWTPLFLNAGALVTEIGGMLSHGAIVAREYGLPAVLNVKGVTGLIKNGQMITVDGHRGIVQVLDKNGRDQVLSLKND